MREPFDVVILGLAVTSSWGNGHATTYRSLIQGLAARGHRVLFLERNAPWYAANRDEPQPAGGRTELYEDLDELVARFEGHVAGAKLAIVGSYVPEGVRIGSWVTAVSQGITAFYDIDTPVTLSALAQGNCEYVDARTISLYDMYLSFTGGPVLRTIESRYGAAMARPLYCSVDPSQYQPRAKACRWDLGYLGTYSDDRQPSLENLLLQPARQWPQGRFAVVGPMYPKDILWPPNVYRDNHLAPREHPSFYGSQRFTLNVTREAMKQAGYSPSVRLFEAGACGVAIVSDWWEGLDSLFEVGKEVLIAESAEDTLRYLRDIPESRRLALGEGARRRILAEHTPTQRALQLEEYMKEVHDNVASYPARPHRRNRKVLDGVETGLASQRHRETASIEACRAPGKASDPGRLHEPAGAGH